MGVAFILLSACSTKMSPDAGIAEYDSITAKAIPEGVIPEPNLATLQHYFREQLTGRLWLDSIESQPAANPAWISSDTKRNEFLSNELATSGLISYLFYDDGELIYDELSGTDRLGRYVNDSSHLKSNSIAKSWTSYLLAHAICNGTIESIDTRLDDWPLIEGTLYQNQRLVDLLNMRAGDQFVVTERDGMLETGRWISTASLYWLAERELADTEPAKRKYNYNQIPPTIVLNYLIYKTGYEPEKLLNEAFMEGAGTAREVSFEVQRDVPLERGSAIPVGWATRYDYMRFAIAMLDDWKNNTCVGQYLTEVHDNGTRIRGFYPTDFRLAMATRYGGFFFTHLKGMRDRKVLYMDGYGGQALMIDFDNSRIVSVNAAHDNYNWDELVYQAIKHGDIQRE